MTFQQGFKEEIDKKQVWPTPESNSILKCILVCGTKLERKKIVTSCANKDFVPKKGPKYLGDNNNFYPKNLGSK